MKRVHIKIHGRVQGVFFRVHTDEVAKGLGLTGWVKNTYDGCVEVMAEGSEDKLKQLVAVCHKGPPGSHVENVEEEWLEATGEFKGFSITF